MPREKTPTEWARQSDGIAGRWQEIERAALGAASLEIKTSVVSRLRSTVGADLKMSGVGKRGTRVGVRYDIKGFKNPTSLIRAFGPVHFVERGTKPHRIPKQRNRGRKRYAVIPGVGVRDNAMHPGSTGRFPWRRGVASSIGRAQQEFRDEIARQIRQAFHI